MALAHSVASVVETSELWCPELHSENHMAGCKVTTVNDRGLREEQSSSNFQTKSDCFSLSAPRRPIIPQAATLCSPRLWSFSTKFRLKMFLLRSLSGDEPPPLSIDVEHEGFALWLQCRLWWWGWGEAEMPCSCSSCRSPSDEVVSFVVVGLVVAWTPRPKCCWWDGDEVLTSSQFRQDGRPKEWRLPRETKDN